MRTPAPPAQYREASEPKAFIASLGAFSGDHHWLSCIRAARQIPSCWGTRAQLHVAAVGLGCKFPSWWGTFNLPRTASPGKANGVVTERQYDRTFPASVQTVPRRTRCPRL